ncbi:MAG: hypothetical protein FWF53_08725 [Candidatus Azobacteroides sp.]|nr:hypothetical protein [Candidatus Azobacteroides sp.]
MKRQGFYILFFIPAFTACLESPEMTTGIVNGKEKPTVSTIPVSPFSSGGNLFFQGDITSQGKAEITEKGFYWSTDSNDPGINDNTITITNGDSVFAYELTSASGEKTYYWRAFAKNSYGYDYGEVRSCQTPEIWIQKESFPADSRGNGAVFILNGRIYMTCGIKDQAGQQVEDTWEYNITTNLWSQSDSLVFPGSNRRYPVVFTIGNLAFVGTGQTFTPTLCKDFYQFNVGTRKWTEIATPDDLEARYEAVAFSLNGKGYLIGGLSANSGLNDVWQYNPGNGSWEKKNPFPVNFYGGISIFDSNRCFAGFGKTDESARQLWEYDEETDHWNEVTTLPDEVVNRISSGVSGVIVRNSIYLVDGDNVIWAFNLSDKTWTKKNTLPSDFLNENNEGGFQNLFTVGNSDSVYVGLGFRKLLYVYRPLWDN